MEPKQKLHFLDLFCLRRKFLVYHLVLRNLKIRYRKSYFGLLWTILIPASNAVVYYGVFQFVMRVKLDNYLYFVLSGLIPWTFFSAAVVSGMEALLWNQSILNKVPVPPFAFPLAEVLTGFFNFVFAIPILIIVGLLTHAPWGLGQFYVIYLTLLLVIQAYAIGLSLSYFYIFLRDLKHVIVIVMQIWFYLTPILYSREMVPERFRVYLLGNPVEKIFEGLHELLVHNADVTPDLFWAPTVWTLALMGVAFLVARRFNSSIVESL